MLLVLVHSPVIALSVSGVTLVALSSRNHDAFVFAVAGVGFIDLNRNVNFEALLLPSLFHSFD